MDETPRLERAQAAVADCEAEIAETKKRLEDLYGLLWNARADVRDAAVAVVAEAEASQ